MMLAQQLYEGIDLGPEGSTGLITYMRTDSTRVSETAKEEAAQYISQHFGQDYFGQKRRTGRQSEGLRMPMKRSAPHPSIGILNRSNLICPGISTAYTG